MAGRRLSQRGMRWLRYQEAVMHSWIKRTGQRLITYYHVVCGCSDACGFIRSQQEKNERISAK